MPSRSTASALMTCMPVVILWCVPTGPKPRVPRGSGKLRLDSSIGTTTNRWLRHRRAAAACIASAIAATPTPSFSTRRNAASRLAEPLNVPAIVPLGRRSAPAATSTNRFCLRASPRRAAPNSSCAHSSAEPFMALQLGARSTHSRGPAKEVINRELSSRGAPHRSYDPLLSRSRARGRGGPLGDELDEVADLDAVRRVPRQHVLAGAAARHDGAAAGVDDLARGAAAPSRRRRRAWSWAGRRRRRSTRCRGATRRTRAPRRRGRGAGAAARRRWRSAPGRQGSW